MFITIADILQICCFEMDKFEELYTFGVWTKIQS